MFEFRCRGTCLILLTATAGHLVSRPQIIGKRLLFSSGFFYLLKTTGGATPMNGLRYRSVLSDVPTSILTDLPVERLQYASQTYILNKREDIMKCSNRRRGLFEEYRRELLLRGYSQDTIRSYTSDIRSLRKFFPTEHPRDLTEEDIREYLVYLIDVEKKAYSTINQVFNAIRFLYVELYKRPFVITSIPRPKRGNPLPKIITLEEFKQMVDCTINLKHKSLLMVAYSGGLRLRDVIRLIPSDIDGKRKLILIRGGKGRKDRYTIISEAALNISREYFRICRPKRWLYEGRKLGKHIHKRTAQKIVEHACRRARLSKIISTHTLRHSFATHLHEQEYDILTIKELLGHAHLRTTEIYTHVSKRNISSIVNPLDTIFSNK
jgi:integrase/recombinase XerD